MRSRPFLMAAASLVLVLAAGVSADFGRDPRDIAGVITWSPIRLELKLVLGKEA